MVEWSQGKLVFTEQGSEKKGQPINKMSFFQQGILLADVSGKIKHHTG